MVQLRQERDTWRLIDTVFRDYLDTRQNPVSSISEWPWKTISRTSTMPSLLTPVFFRA